MTPTILASIAVIVLVTLLLVVLLLVIKGIGITFITVGLMGMACMIFMGIQL